MYDRKTFFHRRLWARREGGATSASDYSYKSCNPCRVCSKDLLQSSTDSLLLKTIVIPIRCWIQHISVYYILFLLTHCYRNLDNWPNNRIVLAQNKFDLKFPDVHKILNYFHDVILEKSINFSKASFKIPNTTNRNMYVCTIWIGADEHHTQNLFRNLHY